MYFKLMDFFLKHQTSSCYLYAFNQSPFCDLEPTQDDGRPTAMLSHSSEDKGELRWTV